uniref:ATP-binding cassette transporter sub-family C member 4 n=1 Tax=Tigriopus japonicus TaxID=158387 RepID=A0A0A7ARM2_TIGJA|nr:ATP-binding cassette transporter sub-family C member 4 [Tigriopus japonicus]
MDAEEAFQQKPNPRENANILSIAFFWWLNPLMWLGYKKNLEIQDLYRALKIDQSADLNSRIEKHWQRELDKQAQSNNKHKPSLFRAVIRTFYGEFCFLGLFTFFEECLIRIAQPVFLSWFVAYFTPGQTAISRTEAYIYGFAVVLMSALYTFTHHPYFFGVMKVGMRVRITLSALVYRKALKLSSAALGQSTVGQMVNLLANDVNRFDGACLFIHYLWAGPLQLLIVVYLTWNEMGVSTMAGAGIILISVPLQSWIGRMFSKLRLETAKKTDTRIRIMNEIINGIKVIKMYAWEFSFMKLIESARESEMDVIRRTAYFRGFNFSFFFVASKVILLAILIPYVLTGQIINAEKVFLTLSLYNTVRLSMTLFVPFAISMGSEGLVSIGRIQKFLMMEERDKTCLACVHEESSSKEKPISLDICGLTASWTDATADPTLNNVSFSARAGEIVAIVGTVGSGKTSMLQAVLGEIPSKEGKINIRGRVSYAAQEPWVFSGSVRHNILFGENYDEKRYMKTLEVCALEHDLEQWEFGDKTLVGERGVALSGGQKARVSLARAIYRDADIYLLDDPLSAVDAHVGKYLFENCIQSHLKSKLVILVTHQIQFLKDADMILVLKKGSIQGRGTYAELESLGTDFTEFISETKEDQENEEEEEDATLIDGEIPSPKEHRSLSIRSCLQRRSRGYSLGGDSIMSMISGVSEDILEYDQVMAEENNTEEKKKPKVEAESVVLGAVSLAAYWSYFRAGAGVLVLICVLSLNIGVQVIFTGADVWLGIWTNQEEQEMQQSSISANNSTNTTKIFTMEDISQSNTNNLYIFGAMTLSLVVASLIRTIQFLLVCKNASTQLHHSMFKRIIRAPSRFFDINPVGRVLNRFSKDMGSIDELLPPVFLDVITIFLTMAGIVSVIVWYQPIVFLPTCIMAVLFTFLRKFYLSSSRAIKRAEGVAKSPIFSQLASTLGGLTSIRAYRAEHILVKEFDRIQDVHTSAWYSFLATTRWFGLWLDWLVVVYLACCVCSFLFMNGSSQSGDVGVVLSSCIMLTGMLQWGMRQTAEMENLMTSTERVLEYGKIQSEAELKTDHPPPGYDEEAWPGTGVLECNDVCLQYGEGEKMVLKGVNFLTKPREKVGIVGRTGAGKSSLIGALFRLTEPTGQIILDGVNIQQLGLHALRKKISIIPQDPLVFTGSLRKNLDPFDDYQDHQIWQALEQVHLDQAVKHMSHGLETEMSEGGSNLSAGQRQLICLARAILKHNKILVLDEATANVDPRTDMLIQETIRTRFADCTVLTIAHRLHTVMDSDRILVMSDGKVAEFNTPYELLQDPRSVLSELVANVSLASQLKLRRIAREAFVRQKNLDLAEPKITNNIRNNSFVENSKVQIMVEDDEKIVTKL